MKKPITLTIQEFKENLIEIVNSSGLPFFVTEPILKELLDAVRAGANKKLEADMEEYSAFLRQQEETEEKQKETEGEPESTQEGG